MTGNEKPHEQVDLDQSFRALMTALERQPVPAHLRALADRLSAALAAAPPVAEDPGSLPPSD
ncbi:hypothetical protein ACEYYB_11165 [Paracoccus sp. p4-l81]|uniref:hypothetical protein n=1 Tax=Paracoccus sp. p4-l81 TaxID=3342806 RepID=UPI0035BA7DBB